MPHCVAVAVAVAARLFLIYIYIYVLMSGVPFRGSTRAPGYFDRLTVFALFIGRSPAAAACRIEQNPIRCGTARQHVKFAVPLASAACRTVSVKPVARIL